MEESYGATLERFRDLVADQLAGYRVLLETTRSATDALRTHDVARFDDVLQEQVETLRRLKELENERGEIVRAVGGEHADDRLTEMRQQLRALASEVRRAGRVERLVIERNGALVEARLGLHRQAGTLAGASALGVHQVA
jgi:dsDNA-specific endonuclease/ATPase MutS2